MGDKIVKPIFRPKSYWGAPISLADEISVNMRMMHSILNIDMISLPLIWDGGNLVTNGKVGFITERIIKDNKKKYTRKQIEKIINDTLKIKPVFITELKGDKLAHSDGYLAFINENTVLLSEYPVNKLFEKIKSMLIKLRKY